jgi:hypothetical protein
MTFLSGFAEGFTTERNRRLEREAEKEDTQFKYGMDILMQNRERRDAKRLEETEMANQAKMIAQNLNDPDFAPTALKLTKLKMSPEKIMESYSAGTIKKNPKFVPQETTIKIPQGVVNTRDVQYDEGMNLSPEVQKRMDELDPSLRRGTETVEADASVINEGENVQYLWNPTNEVKVGSYEQAEYDYQLALKSKDPQKIADAKLKRDVHQSVETQKAVTKAKAEGKNVKSYVMLDPETGEISSKFAGEMVVDADGQEVLKNIGNNSMNDVNGNPINLSVLASKGQIREFSDDDAKQLFDLQNRFGKQAADYNTAADKYVGAITTADTVNKILTQYPAVTTMSSNAAVFVKGLQDEAQGAYTLLVNEQTEIDAAIESGNVDGIGGKVSEYEESLNNFAKDFMSQGNTNIAMAKALYEGQRKLLAYQFAAANGITGAGLNKKDYDNFYESTGGNKSAPEVMNAIRQTAYGVFNVIDSARDTLDNNQEVKTFERYHGVKTGLSATRLGEKLKRTNPALMPVLNDIVNVNKAGKEGAVASTQPQPEVQEQPAVQVKSKAEFDKLPSGTTFIAPDGTKRIKP